MPSGDKWELIDRDQTSLYFGKKMNFNFSPIKVSSLKELLKKYCWRNYRNRNLALNSLLKITYHIRYFSYFLLMYNIKSLAIITNNEIEDFLSFLKITTCIRQDKKLSFSSQRQAFQAVKGLIKWGQVYAEELVPNENVFSGNEFSGFNNRPISISYLDDEQKSKLIKALDGDPEQILIPSAIKIVADTGIRLGDLLKLKTDCISNDPITGEAMISWFDHKKHVWRDPIPATPRVIQAVNDVIEKTNQIRNMAAGNIRGFLFLAIPKIGKRAGKIVRMNDSLYRSRQNIFLKKHSLDKIGLGWDIHVRLRRTLATDMLSDNKSPMVVQAILGHESYNTTERYYAFYKNESHVKAFSGFIVGDIDTIDKKIVGADDELEWFIKNKNKLARMEDGYCTKPFKRKSEICNHLKNRKNCYGCNRFVTTPEYLPFFRDFMEGLEKDVEQNRILGKHYLDHIIPTISIVKEIINQLEVVSSCS